MTNSPASDAGARRTSTILLVLGSCSTVFLDYWEYSRSYHADPSIWASILAGTGAAPAQYRIGVLKAAEFITLHSHLAMRHALGFIDLAALLTASFVLRDLLLLSATFRSASIAAKWFGLAAFTLLVQYGLAWLIWYQRPETLTVAALLALSLWLCTRRLPIEGPAGNILTALCLVTLGVLLGFTRADAGFTFHLGIALACLLGLGANFALPRWLQFSTSLLAASASASVQFYLMRVVYPHAGYGSTPMFQLRANFTDHTRLVPFVLLIVPTVWVVAQVLRHRFKPGAAQTGLLIGTAIFMGLWLVLGKIDEVRIFLPFALTLIPLAVEIAMARVAAAESASDTRNVC